ncbi:unnamed protein product [Schistosoma margrebowiei]|uniref:Uncharacterized protein n=1 Tax=Schistosoma margrebowiei TaxID=48269 RepID=A0A183MHC7_9TREM|nr:unnamed protein product [Schistosoma margrebowiei]
MPNCSFQDARTACINYEAVNELDIQSMKISNTLLSRPDELQSQGQSNLRSFNGESYCRVNMKGVSTRDYKANHKGEMKFGKCLSCGKFHLRNSCAFRNAKCFKCGKMGHIQSVCKATVHFASSSTKSCHLNLNNSDVSSDHLSLSTISKAIFQEVMNKVVSDLEGVEVYQDDLIVHGSNEVVHDQRLIALLRRLIEKNITVNPNNAIRKGWTANLKRRFPIYFSKRDELSTTPDGILCLNDRVVIPPSLRKSVLANSRYQ